MGIRNEKFSIGERVYIGKEGRAKIISVLGRIDYENLTSSAKNELQSIVEKIVSENESRFIDYFNSAQPMTPRVTLFGTYTWNRKNLYEIYITRARKK